MLLINNLMNNKIQVLSHWKIIKTNENGEKLFTTRCLGDHNIINGKSFNFFKVKIIEI